MNTRCRRFAQAADVETMLFQNTKGYCRNSVCRLQALAALFLMSNAHYQLKAITGTSLEKYVSKGFQEDCETKASHLLLYTMIWSLSYPLLMSTRCKGFRSQIPTFSAPPLERWSSQEQFCSK